MPRREVDDVDQIPLLVDPQPTMAKVRRYPLVPTPAPLRVLEHGVPHLAMVDAGEPWPGGTGRTDAGQGGDVPKLERPLSPPVRPHRGVRERHHDSHSAPPSARS